MMIPFLVSLARFVFDKLLLFFLFLLLSPLGPAHSRLQIRRNILIHRPARHVEMWVMLHRAHRACDLSSRLP
jgi:hypothetical protein